MKDNFDYVPIAVVTGASSGIGLELAKVFAENGYDLMIVADSEKIHTAAEALKGKKCQVEVVQADLSKPEGVEQLCEKINTFSKRIEAVAINAGIGSYGKFFETELEKDLELLSLNIVGAVHLSKQVLKNFVKKGRGRILYTSSIAAEMPGPYTATYAASKAFLKSFAEAIRSEVKDLGITITTLQPGPTDTDFFERANMQESKVAQQEKDDPAKVAKQGFDALMAGDDHVVAGSFKNKVQATIAKFATDKQRAAMQKSQTKPQSPS